MQDQESVEPTREDQAPPAPPADEPQDPTEISAEGPGEVLDPALAEVEIQDPHYTNEDGITIFWHPADGSRPGIRVGRVVELVEARLKLIQHRENMRLRSSREIALAITRLQECADWIARAMRLGVDL
jgi:hypothetical protein